MHAAQKEEFGAITIGKPKDASGDELARGMK